MFYRTSSPSGPLPKKAGFRPEKADFRPEKAWGGLMDKWMDGWTDRWTDKQKSPCVLQDFVPFGAAAQKGEKF